MLNFSIIISEEAQNDFEGIVSYLFDYGGVQSSNKFTTQFYDLLDSLMMLPHRGTIHSETYEGLRIIGLAKRATIAFVVEADKVVILRVIYKGGDWVKELDTN